MQDIIKLTDEQLNKLRKEITLGSIYYADYINSFNIDEKTTSDFFDGFIDYMYELADEAGDSDAKNNFNILVEKYDNIENLLAWQGCFDL